MLGSVAHIQTPQGARFPLQETPPPYPLPPLTHQAVAIRFWSLELQTGPDAQHLWGKQTRTSQRRVFSQS